MIKVVMPLKEHLKLNQFYPLLGTVSACVSDYALMRDSWTTEFIRNFGPQSGRDHSRSLWSIELLRTFKSTIR